MAHGHGTGPSFLIDEDGNAVKVEYENGKYLLAVTDERLLEELRQLREALTAKKRVGPWDRSSPWKGTSDG